MQLPAAQTSLEPQPRRVDQQGRKPFVSQNATEDDGSRLTSEPYRSNARASQHPGSQPRAKQVADYGHHQRRTSERYVGNMYPTTLAALNTLCASGL
jgi:hypothetical protein